MAAIIAWFSANAAWLFAFLFGLSEAIGMIPGIPESSVFQMVKKVLVWIKDTLLPKPKA